ncbi:MAG: L-asparaginase [Ilumatobacteraceae bacterium]
MNPRPTVTVISLGGTIASAPSTESGLAGPRLSARELTSGLPQLDELAEVEVIDLARLPSCDVTFDLALAVAAEVSSAASRGSSGVVVTQGSDTIEEMAFCLDLLVTEDVPVVVVGAMRHSALPGAEGAANLLDAVRTVLSPDARGLGCLVVMNEEIHCARVVRKRHTSSPAAFYSEGVGPCGWIVEGVAHLRDRPYARVVLDLPAVVEVVRLPLVRMTFDDDGWWIPAITQLDAKGLVIEGTGGGHVPSWLADDIVKLARRIPVVLTSRTGGGTVLTSTYGGFKGSESALVDGGLIPAGTLDGLKARVLLTLLLTAGTDRAGIEQAIATVGQVRRTAPTLR